LRDNKAKRPSASQMSQIDVRIQRPRAADFQVGWVAGFLTRKPLAISTPCRFGNRRHGRLGNLRHSGCVPVCHQKYEML